MTPGPLRRVTGTVGLIALAPTALLLALDQLEPVDAAMRALATLALVLVVGRVAGWWLTDMAVRFEQQRAATEPGDAPAEERRASSKR